MALIIADRVGETTLTAGTGDFELEGAVSSYRAFSAVMADEDTTYYVAISGASWEVGLGTYESTGDILKRTTVLASTNGGSKVSFSGARILMTLPGNASAIRALAGLGTMSTQAASSVAITGGTFSGITAASVTGNIATTADGFFFSNNGGSAGTVRAGIKANGTEQRLEVWAGDAQRGFFSATAVQLPGVYNTTTGSAANVNVDSSGVLARSTSAAKYKRDFTRITPERLALFKQLVGGTYFSLCSGDDPDHLYSGVLADQASELGLHDLVSYGADGEVEGFAYERAAAYFLEWNKEQVASIASHASRLAEIEAALNLA